MEQSKIISLLANFVWRVIEAEKSDTPLTEERLEFELLRWSLDQNVTLIKLKEEEDGAEG